MKNLFLLFAIAVYGLNSFASELFIRVNSPIEFYVSAQNQTIYNSKNVFKFYDLQMGNTSFIVMNRMTSAVTINSSVLLGANERVVIEVAATGVVSIVQRVPIQEVNWYTTVDQFQNNGNGFGGNYPPTQPPYYPPHQNGNNFPNQPATNASSIHPIYFDQFLESLQKETMDASKLKSAKNFVKKNNLTAEQIAKITRKFSFDANRLDFAKYAYDYCLDKGYYFILKDSFDFSSNYNSLLKHIENK